MIKAPGFAFLILILFACNEGSTDKVSKDNDRPNDTIVTGAPTVNPYAPVDASPMDMAYFPTDYPKLKMAGQASEPPVARVIYSRPHKQGRVIFGGLQQFGQVWRLGANEASEIEFFRPVTISGKKVNTGRYLIYCIPQEDKWTIVLNSNVYTWGLKIDSTKDLVRFDIPTTKLSNPVEYFTMVFRKTDDGAALVMAWDVVEARLPFTF